MNRKQFGKMLADMREALDNHLDPQLVLNEYRKKFKYAYVYSDPIAKTLFGTKEHEILAVDLLNAILKLDGANRIRELQFSSTERGAEIGTKHVNSDIIADWNGDRIVLEFQHEGDERFKQRLVYYMARDTIPMLHPGENYRLNSLYTVSVQLFNEPLYRGNKNYRHTILLKDDENRVFYEKQVLTLVEVLKFLESDNSGDNCRLAQWLRAIDAINNEENVVFNDSTFAGLQKAAELCNFDAMYFCTEAKTAMDYEYEMEIQLKREVAEQLAEKVAVLRGEIEKQAAEQTAKLRREFEEQAAKKVAELRGEFEKQAAEKAEAQFAEQLAEKVAEARREFEEQAANQVTELVTMSLQEGMSPESASKIFGKPLEEVLAIKARL